MNRKRRKDSMGRVLKDGERVKGKGYEYRWTDRFGKRHSFFAGTLTQLREKEEQLIRNQEQEVSNDTKKITLNNLYFLWRKVKKGLKANTFQNYQYMYEQYVMDTFGNVKIMDMKKSDIKDFYNKLYENGLKPSTIDGVHTVIHQVLEMAIDDDIIRYNPSDKALKELMMEHSKDTKKVKALTQEEEALLVNYMYNDPEDRRWYPIFVVMMMAGLRVGEATALQWSDVDFENNTIDINKTLVYYDIIADHTCRHAINSTKTTASTRKVEMISMVKEAFLMEKEYQEELGITCQANVDGYDDFIFLNRFGSVHNHSTLNKALSRVVKNCNEYVLRTSDKSDPLLLPKVHNHMLRHTYGTRLNDAGVNVKAMQAMMGHSDLETTMQIYVDPSSQIMSKATQSYEDMINKMFPERNAK